MTQHFAEVITRSSSELNLMSRMLLYSPLRHVHITSQVALWCGGCSKA